MASFTDLTNRFNHGSFGSKQLQALKDHIKEYFIVGEGTQGLANLRLDIVGEESLSVDSDVTDHYVESNQAYQDQISLKPKIYTISGEVGELVWYQKDKASQVFGQVAQRLEGVTSLLPVRSRGFNQMKNYVMKAAQWVDTASNAASKIANLSNQLIGYDSDNEEVTRSITHQQQAYSELLAMRDNRNPVSIQTPWGILKDYVITNLKLTQPKETKDKSTISITFKEFRTTSITTVAFDPEKYQGNALYENQPETKNGKTEGEDKSISKPISSQQIEDMSADLGANLGSMYGEYVTNQEETLGCATNLTEDSLEYFKKIDGQWKNFKNILDAPTQEENDFLEQCVFQLNEKIGS